jgi:hypothetical protein
MSALIGQKMSVHVAGLAWNRYSWRRESWTLTQRPASLSAIANVILNCPYTSAREVFWFAKAMVSKWPHRGRYVVDDVGNAATVIKHLIIDEKDR